MSFIHEKIQFLENQIQELDRQKVSLQAELKKTQDELQKHPSTPSLPLSSQITNKTFSPEEKIKIFMNLFRGRIDVFPKRWSNAKSGKSGYSLACANEWVRGKCNKPKVKCSQCPNQAFTPVAAEIIRKHLGGEDFAGGKRDYTIGIYPMLVDDTCWFLAADFDKDKWQQLIFHKLPEPTSLSLVGFGALIVNSGCALLLAEFKSHPGSMVRAAFLSARNDAAANIAIILTGLFTSFYSSIWPDIIVGLAIAALNAGAAKEVYHKAREEQKLSKGVA